MTTSSTGDAWLDEKLQAAATDLLSKVYEIRNLCGLPIDNEVGNDEVEAMANFAKKNRTTPAALTARGYHAVRTKRHDE